MSDGESLLKRLTAFRKAGAFDEGRYALRESLRRDALTPEEFEGAGRFLEKVRGDSSTGHKVVLLGQCTTSRLAAALTTAAFQHGLDLHVEQGEYDNVLQDITTRCATNEGELLVLLPWHQRLLAQLDRSSAQRIEDELGFWTETWRIARQNGFSRIIQVGYDWVGPGASGFQLGSRGAGDVALIRQVNRALVGALPADAFFVDLEQVSGISGRTSFYDPRQYNWTKQPFSQRGVVELSQQIFAGVRATLSGPKKVLVLDLDNTIWGGVVGETGPLGVVLGEGADGEAFQAFQRHIKQLSERGVLLAVASKNNQVDAREPFEKHADSVLRLNDFAAFEACWEPKAVMLTRIAATLNLATDSFVFFDDNPAEREHIRQLLPEVAVVEVPGEPAEYIRTLEVGGWFEANALTEEDQSRTKQYAVERQRNELRAGFESLDGYLKSLDMVASVTPIHEVDLRRVVQLLAKTNQFNLTTRRHAEEQVREMTASQAAIHLALRMRDRFGDYGLVACALAVPVDNSHPRTLRIDSWLMSCRVIGRGVEQVLFGELVSRARAAGYHELLGEYRPTSKNALVANFYPDLGFAEINSVSTSTRFYRLAIADARPTPGFIVIES